MTGTTGRRAWRARALTAVLSGVLVTAGMLATAPAAWAAPSVGTPTFTAPATVDRGAGPVPFSVEIATTEGATFTIAASGSDLTLALPGSCTTDNAGASCSIVAGAVTIGSDADATAEEALQATFAIAVSAASSVALASTEGVVLMSKDSGITVTATATGTTTGGTQTSAEGDTDIIANPSVDAVVELTTSTSPAQPSPDIVRGASSTITYTATLTRSGFVNQSTAVSVLLVPVAAQGTTIGSSNPQTVTFLPTDTSETANFTVNVPANAAAGSTASYRFVGTYDPTGTDGSPVDTETGADTPFDITAANPTVALSLAGSPTDTSTVARGDGATYTLTATNTAAAGAVDATNVSVTLPLPSSSQLTIGTPTSSSGTPTVNTGDGSTPQSVSVTFTSIAPGSTATLTVPVTVTAGAVKTTGTNNDLVAGPATGTFSPPAATAATASATVRYEIRDDADLALTLLPATQTLAAGDEAVVTATLTNNGPEPAPGTDVVLTVAETAGSGSPSFVGFTAPFPAGCVIDPTPTTMHCTANTLAVNDSVAFAVRLTQSGAGTATVTATASATNTDPNPADNGPLTADVVFTAVPSLSTNVNSVAFASRGVGTTSATRSVVVTSDGTAPVDITGVSVVGANAADFTVVSQNCTAGVLDPSETCTVQLRFRPSAIGLRSATLRILSNAPDSPDTVALSGRGTARADLRISMGATPNPVHQNSQLTYKVVAANSGPTSANQVKVTVALPSGSQFVSLAQPAGWSCSKPAPGTTGTIVCQRPSLASGATNTFSIVVKVVAARGSTISSTASISSSTFDPVLADNKATVTTAVS
jgi:uncharacterized repeat protein (TIGR01451 family)